MQPENRQYLRDFLAHAPEMAKDLCNDASEILGKEPAIFSTLKERQDYFILSVLADFLACRPESLDPATAELVAIAAATAADAPHCVKVHIGAALKAGATRDQVRDTIFIAGALGRSKVLASGLRELESVCGKR
jgi:4-carboxymuconolactone decarboxylase